MTLTRRLRDRLLAADPGLSRLGVAARATLLVMAAAWALSHVAEELHQPATMAFIGIVVAMMSGQVVADRTRRARVVTQLLLPLPAAAGLVAGTLLAPSHAASLAGFLVTSFLSVEARRHGPRAFGAGLTMFMTYFCALFFQAKPAALPGMLGAIAGATALALLLRFAVLRDKPERVVRWLQEAFRARVALLLGRLAELAGCRERSRRAVSKLLRDLAGVNETALALEDALENPDVEAALSAEERARLAHRAFEVEIALTHVVDAALRASRLARDDEAKRARLSDALACAAELVRARRAWSGSAPDELVAPLAALFAAWRADAAPAPPPVAKAAAPAPPAPGLHPTTRQAIQAAAASGIAALAGARLSAPTWSWAAMAAFIVFASGQTRGDTLKRAFQRILGTACGVVAGFLLASAATTRETELGLVFACIFLGIYMSRRDYAWATLWFTAMVAVLYKLLGRLSEQILALRVEQTLVGVAAAALATLLVLPQRARGPVVESLVSLLRTVARKLDALANGGAEAHALVRELDRDLQTLRATAAPLLGNLTRVRSPLADGLVHDATALVFYVRELAVAVAATAPEDPCHAELAQACAALATETRDKAAELDVRVESRQLPNLARRAVADVPARHLDDGSPARHWIDRIHRLLGALAERLA